MTVVSAIVGVALIAVVLWDAFETVVLPRTVTRRLRLTRLYYQLTWGFWSRAARAMAENRRERFLAVYGPLSLIALLGVWAAGLVLGFALLQQTAGSDITTPSGHAAFADDLY